MLDGLKEIKMEKKFYSPELSREEYHCPHCYVYAKQLWATIDASTKTNYVKWLDKVSNFNGLLGQEWALSKCTHCGKIMVWFDKNILYPKTNLAPTANEDLNADIIDDYNEAANILNDSPRAAAALLRLALQKLCKELGEKGENINEDIKNLVKKGLNPLVQKSLDSLRITGNNAVHPGEIDLMENPDKVLKMFELINFIASKMITEPKTIEEFYSSLPESSIDAITKRDSN